MKRHPVRGLGILLSIFIASSMSGCGAGDNVQAQSTPSTLATKDLSAFVNTYWYVPTDYLLAYTYNSSGNPKTTAVNDQTIWHFTAVNQGFLLGCSFASTNNGATWSASTIVGSVTANNSVSIGFYGSSLTVGSGQLTISGGQPTFLMQMSTGNGTAGLTHWAYMLPITSSDSVWTNLPGTNSVSVPSATASGC